MTHEEQLAYYEGYKNGQEAALKEAGKKLLPRDLVPGRYFDYEWECPTCRLRVLTKPTEKYSHHPAYCEHCGQKLNYSEEYMKWEQEMFRRAHLKKWLVYADGGFDKAFDTEEEAKEYARNQNAYQSKTYGAYNENNYCYYVEYGGDK